MSTLSFTYLLMILMQVFQIFEEIGMGAYKVAHSLSKYLFAASVLVTINFVAFALITYEIRFGLFLGAGVFTGIPLAIMGVIVFIQLIQNL